jgi:hypothetical protein
MFMRNWLAIAALSAMVGCATAPQLSPAQRRSLQMRTFEHTTYDNVFRAFKTILQDEGYIVKNQDMAGGLILATVEKTDNSGAFFAAMGGHSNYRTGEGFEVSVNLEKINPTTVETRMIIQKIDSYNLGGKQGREILDEQLYKALYDRVKVEVERRKAQGKSE